MSCFCTGHSSEEIKVIIKEGIIANVGELQEETFIGAGCGHCLPLIEEIFRALDPPRE